MANALVGPVAAAIGLGREVEVRGFSVAPSARPRTFSGWSAEKLSGP